MQELINIDCYYSEINEIMQYLREANIILIAINQIKTNPQLGIVKSPAEILGLKMDETLDLCNTKVKFVYSNIN